MLEHLDFLIILRHPPTILLQLLLHPNHIIQVLFNLKDVVNRLAVPAVYLVVRIHLLNVLFEALQAHLVPAGQVVLHPFTITAFMGCCLNSLSLPFPLSLALTTTEKTVLLLQLHLQF